MNEVDVQSLMSKGTLVFPEAGSAVASSVDLLFYVIFWGSLLLFMVMVGIGVYFIAKYKRTDQNRVATAQITHNNVLEIGWTVIPLIIVLIIFVWGYRDYLKLVIPPEGTTEIRVVGKKWLWEVEYPKEGLKLLNEIVVPVGKPVKLLMTSTDVLHSFFLPNFRIKKDLVPNRYSQIWFHPERVGDYQIFCTEYCGDGHSNMLGVLRVLSQSDYDEWVQSGNASEDVPLPELGKKLYKSKNCNVCHSLDGSPMAGPTWKGLYGRERAFTDGKKGVADEDYIAESILNPNAKIVEGYPPVMPSYSGLLSEREVLGVIEYIKTLK